MLFQVDVNHILTVSAMDKGTGNEERIVVGSDTTRLSPEEIESMIEDAERFSEEDKLSKERVDARNDLESYAYTLRNQVKDTEGLGGRLSEEERESVEEAVTSAITWLEENNDVTTEEFRERKQQLEAVVHPIVSKMYEQSENDENDARDEL